MLVPGIDGTGLTFHRQVPLLSRRYAVTTARLRDTADRMDDLVADLDAIVATAAPGGGPVTLLGESFGGALTLSYALAHPERVSKLVILNSFAHLDSPRRLWLAYQLARATPWGLMPVARRLAAWRLHSPQTSREEIRHFHRLMRASTQAGYLSRLRMLQTYDVRRQLGAIEAPVLYLASEGDNLVPSVQQAHLMKTLTPRATVRILEGHGHICLIAPNLDLSVILDEWTASA
ncbi:MAG: alpha/beta fold hydrolase [Vicinamibacterales bacterium]